MLQSLQLTGREVLILMPEPFGLKLVYFIPYLDTNLMRHLFNHLAHKVNRKPIAVCFKKSLENLYSPSPSEMFKWSL